MQGGHGEEGGHVGPPLRKFADYRQ